MVAVTNERYNTFWPRFWAGWIDAAVWIPLIFVDLWVEANIHSHVLLALWLVVNTLSFDIYSVAMHAKYGQTLGKMALGVKVLDVSEGRLSLRQALLRDSVPIALGLVMIVDDLPRILAGAPLDNEGFGLWMQVGAYGSVLWFAAELITMLTNSKRRALHDFIAGSVVVRTRLPEK
jgi:uncharacterized RDD family membrane protein YckC